jgi:hypothetical protein
MKTKCYLLDNTLETTDALMVIKRKIPCWVTVNVLDDGYELVAEIKCRAEDVAFVERTLAEFV